MKAVAEAYHFGSIAQCFHNCWSHSLIGPLISIWCFRRPLGPPSPESPQVAIYVRNPWHVSLASWTWKLKILWIGSSTKCSQFILTTYLISPGLSTQLPASQGHTNPSNTTREGLIHINGFWLWLFFLEIPLWIILINRAVTRFILVLHLGISKHVVESDSDLSNTTVAWSDWVFRCSKKWVSARLGANWSTGSVLGFQIKTLHSVFVHFYSGYMENVKQSLSFSTNSLVYDLKWNDNQVSLYWCSTPRASNVLSLGAFLIMFTADSSIVFSEWLALVRVALSFCISGMQALFSKTFKHFLLLTEDEEMDKSSLGQK